MKAKLKDPRYLYKSDEFPDQEQDKPALQDEMIPEPDCGEKGYIGHERLKGRNALITGGDSGIGRAAAIAFAREKSNVAIQYYPGEEKDAFEVRDYIEKEGVKCLLIPIDLKEEGAGAEVVRKAYDEFGQLDILVLNAGQQYSCEKLSELSMKQVRETFDINIISMFESVKEAEKYLEPGSSIITTSSIQAFQPSAHLMDYACTKAAIWNFTKSLAEYFAEKGIRVNSVAPGPIWTPLQLDDGQPDGKIPEFGQKSLLGRAGQPVELAPVYVFLASDEASYVTAQVYGVTGGDTLC